MLTLHPCLPSGLAQLIMLNSMPMLTLWHFLKSFQCCCTSTETTRLIRDGEPRTATSTFTHVLSSDSLSAELILFLTRSCAGSIVNEGGLKSLAGSVVIDDDQIYSLTSEVKVDEKPAERMRVLTPMVELRRPGAEAITLMGSIQMDTRGRSFNTDLTLSGVTKKELQVQGRKGEKSSHLVETLCCIIYWPLDSDTTIDIDFKY